MRYMLLIYSAEATETPERVQEATVQHHAVIDEAEVRGTLRAADPLKSSSVATTVRRKRGKPFVTDGPFADTKEQLAGYYVLECRDLDEAIDWAKKIPTTCDGDDGGVEIRPIQTMRAWK
jgi:hypothetical protein